MLAYLLAGSLVTLSANFNPEPVFIKGAGRCEGIECADLDGDGKLDLVRGIPMKGHLHFFRNTGTQQRPVFADRVVLTDSQTGEPVKLSHW